MSEEMIAIIVTSLISLVSLIISLKNYLINKPKLKVSISDKTCDVYYGFVCAKDDREVNENIGAVEINIINNSPVDIYIKNVVLKIGKDKFRLVNKDISYWEFLYFFYYDKVGEKQWDGVGMYYKESGLEIPQKVKSYTISSGTCLFYFPNIKSKSKRGKIILLTAVGKVTKRVRFIRYDENYVSAEMKEVMLSYKNNKPSTHNRNIE